MTDRGDDPFVRHKSRHVVTYTLANAKRLHELPYAVDPTERPYEGRTVIVVGAGPSLAKNGHHLAEAQRKGVPIFGVNASAGPLRALGVTPDVIVVRESVDTSDQIAATDARCVVVDIGAHVEAWNAARDRDGHAMVFLPLYPRHAMISRKLGLRMVGAGTAAQTSAVSLALEWGATRVVLVGCDLAMGAEGRVYHDAAPRGAARATETAEGGLAFTGDEQDRERALRSGQKPHDGTVGFERVIAADWSGTLPALHTWQSQREWLQIHAQRYFISVEFINATEGGGGILWWANRRLKDVIASEPELEPCDVPTGLQVPKWAVDRVADDLRREAGLTRQVAKELLSTHGPDVQLFGYMGDFIMGSQLVESMAGQKLIDAPKDDSIERVRYVYEAFAEGAELALEALR